MMALDIKDGGGLSKWDENIWRKKLQSCQFHKRKGNCRTDNRIRCFYSPSWALMIVEITAIAIWDIALTELEPTFLLISFTSFQTESERILAQN